MIGGSKASPHSDCAFSSASSASSSPRSSARANGPGRMPAPAIMPTSMSLMPAMPSSRTRQHSTSVLSVKRSTSVSVACDSAAVLIETLSGLGAEVAGLDQLLHALVDVEALVAERLVQVLGHVQCDIEADHVGEEERAHRRRLRLGHDLVDLLWVDPLLVLHAPDLGYGGVEDPVHDEARRLGAADRLLADLLREVQRRLERLLGGLV